MSYYIAHKTYLPYFCLHFAAISVMLRCLVTWMDGRALYFTSDGLRWANYQKSSSRTKNNLVNLSLALNTLSSLFRIVGVKPRPEHFPSSCNTGQPAAANQWIWGAEAFKQIFWSSPALGCSSCNSATNFGIGYINRYPTFFDVVFLSYADWWPRMEIVGPC